MEIMKTHHHTFKDLSLIIVSLLLFAIPVYAFSDDFEAQNNSGYSYVGNACTGNWTYGTPSMDSSFYTQCAIYGATGTQENVRSKIVSSSIYTESDIQVIQTTATSGEARIYFERNESGNIHYISLHQERSQNCNPNCYPIVGSDIPAFSSFTLPVINAWYNIQISTSGNTVSVFVYDQNGTDVGNRTGVSYIPVVSSTKISISCVATHPEGAGTATCNFDNLYANNVSQGDYTNTNTIVFSATSNYNNTILTVNLGTSFYITTWYSNYDWGYFWCNLGFCMYDVLDPNGIYTTAFYAYQQNASQSVKKFSVLKGNYTFRLKDAFGNILTTKNISVTNDTYVNPSNKIWFSNTTSDNDPNINVNIIHSGSGIYSLDYRPYNYTLGNVWQLYTNTIFDMGISEFLGNVSFSISNNVIGITTPILIRARMYDSSQCVSWSCSGTPLSTDYHFYNPMNTTPTPTPTPTLNPTPKPTLSPTPTPTPTPTPNVTITIPPTPTVTSTALPCSGEDTTCISNGTAINNSKDYTNYTTNKTQSYAQTINSSFQWVDYPIKNMRYGIQSINQSLYNFTYSGYMSIITIVVPAVINGMPNKFKALITLSLILSVVLIIFKGKK